MWERDEATGWSRGYIVIGLAHDGGIGVSGEMTSWDMLGGRANRTCA